MRPNGLQPTAPDRELLDAARVGDEGAFRRLVAPHQAELHAHCHRMLASVDDADDALQDALLRAWRGLGGFESRGSVRSWLYRIATNVCLNAIARRPRRVLPIDYGSRAWMHDLHDALGKSRRTKWVDPHAAESLALEDGYTAPEARYERRESVELAFVAALEHLPPRQRAVLILREVLGFSAREVAQRLDTTTASVNSALQRARTAVDERLPARGQQATVRSLGDERIRELVEAFADACETGDVDAIVAIGVAGAGPCHAGAERPLCFVSSPTDPAATRSRGRPSKGRMRTTFGVAAGGRPPLRRDRLRPRSGARSSMLAATDRHSERAHRSSLKRVPGHARRARGRSPAPEGAVLPSPRSSSARIRAAFMPGASPFAIRPKRGRHFTPHKMTGPAAAGPFHYGTRAVIRGRFRSLSCAANERPSCGRHLPCARK